MFLLPIVILYWLLRCECAQCSHRCCSCRRRPSQFFEYSQGGAVDCWFPEIMGQTCTQLENIGNGACGIHVHVQCQSFIVIVVVIVLHEHATLRNTPVYVMASDCMVYRVFDLCSCRGCELYLQRCRRFRRRPEITEVLLCSVRSSALKVINDRDYSE